MQGEYRGDFTRDTFHPANHFSRVLMQQGRVQIDADSNEQASILLHYLRSLGGDLIGRHGGPNPSGFGITLVSGGQTPNDLGIGAGHYYVDGILCEAGPGLTYLGQPGIVPQQPGQPPAQPIPPAQGSMLVYLDVWERHVIYAQQDLIREVALGGPDTATRAKVVCQVRLATTLPPNSSWPNANNPKFSDSQWALWTALWQPANRGMLKAQVQPQQSSTDPCVISPDSSYRGTENQLYRVEIHNGGAISATGTAPAPGPTFKWSRENGSVVFPILKLATSAGQTTVTLASLGRDSRLSLQNNDWVEVVDDNSALSGVVDSLLQVVSVDPVALIVTLAGTSAIVVGQPPTAHPILRRWDGTGPVSENSPSPPPNWLTLEDGVQIQFQPPPATPGSAPNQYRSGDYWLIPARVATGGIEWPQQTDAQGNQGPAALPPHGVEHHYAPLAVLTGDSPALDQRRIFNSLAS